MLDQRKHEEEPVPEVLDTGVREVLNRPGNASRPVERSPGGPEIAEPKEPSFVVGLNWKDDSPAIVDDEVLADRERARQAVEHGDRGRHRPGLRSRIAYTKLFEVLRASER